jgi:hypothetical protein
MAETFVLSFVDKLIQLEERAGLQVHYHNAAPISTPLHDRVSIQKVARQIADSIGLSQFQFIITIAKQKKNVGGHIDLSTKDEAVFIEIDPDAMAFPDSVGATLCHEICHKWLQTMGVSSPILIDNEILTDITTVFLGFGKIMLNGCEVKNVKEERVDEGTRTTTETRTSGYLKRDQFAFVYRLVCSMRSVPRSDYMRGLNSDAGKAIQTCDAAFSHYYHARFHQPATTVDVAKDFQTDGMAQQRKLAELNKRLDYIRLSFCEAVDGFWTMAHKANEQLRKRSEAIAEEKSHDPALKFLHSIRKEHELQRMREELSEIEGKVDELLYHSELIGRQIWNASHHFPVPSAEMFNIVKCPKDGTKLRLPRDSADLVVACPTCHYRFTYNTTCLSFEPSLSAKTAQQKISWPRRMLNSLRGR